MLAERGMMARTGHLLSRLPPHLERFAEQVSLVSSHATNPIGFRTDAFVTCDCATIS